MHAEAFWEAWDASLRKADRRPFRAQARGDKLSVSGFVIENVDQVTPTMKKADLKPIYTAGARLVEQCWEIVKQKPYTYQPDQVVEAFASTILCRYKAKDGRYEGAHSVIEQFAGFCMRANVNFYKDLQSNGGLWTLDTTLTAGETFGKTFKWYATNRRFFNKQANGLWGLGLAAMQLGDVCAVLSGADAPFVLRSTGTTGEYKVVGECYMYNFMNGDVVLGWQGGKTGYAGENIVLV